MSLSNINVDIIVPIYNAYEYLKSAIEAYWDRPEKLLLLL